MSFLVLLGIPIDFLNHLTVMLTNEVRGVFELALARHEAINDRLRLALASPGEQYRSHIKSGGYRP